LLSWKQAPPETASERATARLLEELRSAPTLSPEAFARIERRLRTRAADGARRKAIVFGAGPWLPVLAGATAMLLIVGSVAFFSLRKEALLGITEGPSASELAANRTPATGPQDRAGATSPASPQESPDTLWAQREERVTPTPPQDDRLEKSVRRSVSPAMKPTPMAAKSAKGLLENDAASGSAVALGQGAGASSTFDQRAGAKARAEIASGHSAAAAVAAGAPAPSEPAAEAASDRTPVANMPALIDRAELLARMGRCDDAVSLFTSILANGGPDPLMERALYGRGHCRLTLGDRNEGVEDLRAYLARFPGGRFAEEAQGLLGKATQ
jgi:hypothetical protein